MMKTFTVKEGIWLTQTQFQVKVPLPPGEGARRAGEGPHPALRATFSLWEKDSLETSDSVASGAEFEIGIELRKHVIGCGSLTMAADAACGLRQGIGLRFEFSCSIGEVIESPAA